MHTTGKKKTKIQECTKLSYSIQVETKGYNEPRFSQQKTQVIFPEVTESPLVSKHLFFRLTPTSWG